MSKHLDLIPYYINTSTNTYYEALSANTNLSFDAFSSNTASFKAGPSIARARHSILVVLPVPGGP